MRGLFAPALTRSCPFLLISPASNAQIRVELPALIGLMGATSPVYVNYFLRWLFHNLTHASPEQKFFFIQALNIVRPLLLPLSFPSPFPNNLDRTPMVASFEPHHLEDGGEDSSLPALLRRTRALVLLRLTPPRSISRTPCPK